MADIGVHLPVPNALSSVVKHIYCVRTAADFNTMAQHLSPSLEMMLVFNFGSPLKGSFGDNEMQPALINGAALIGPLRKMLNYEVTANTDLLVITFHPNGFYRLFEIPLEQLGDQMLHDPDKLLGISGFHALWEQLKKRHYNEDRLALLTEYGQTFFQEPENEAAPLLESIYAGDNPFGEPSKAIAIDANLSERTIQMRFKKYLGYSTKEHLRFLRFKQVIDFIQKQDTQVDWQAIIERFQYYDQSHLIRDFQHYLATTPRKFVQDFLGKEFCVSKEGDGGEPA